MSEPLIPFAQVTTLTDADTEYEMTLPKGTKAVSLQCRTASAVRVAFATGAVATPTDPYITIKANSVLTFPDKAGWSWTSTSDPDATLYLASSTAGVVVECFGMKDIRD